MKRIVCDEGFVIEGAGDRIKIEAFVLSEGIRHFLIILLLFFSVIWIIAFKHVFAYLFLFIIALIIAFGLFLKYEIHLDLSTMVVSKRLWLYKILLQDMFRFKMDHTTCLILKFNKKITDDDLENVSYFYTLQSSRGHYFFKFSSESTRNTLVQLLDKRVVLRFATNY